MSKESSFIEIMQIEPTLNKNIIRFRGEFCVTPGYDTFTPNDSSVLKHIILVVTRGTNYQSTTPFKDVIVFNDDIKIKNNKCSGFFNVNIFEHIKFDGAGDYYILCSLGVITSNVLKISILN